MGIDLTKQLYSFHAADLTAGELVVLGYMCLVALDKENVKGQPARLYFGGWEPLALVLGYDSLTSAAKEKVRRSIKGVREKGLIKPLVGHAQTGERQVYRIQVGPTGAQLPSPNRATGSEPQEGHNFRGNRGSETEPPRKDSGGMQDLLQDPCPPLPEPQGPPSPKPAQGHKFRGQRGDDCYECGRGYADRAAHPIRLLRGDTA